MSLAKQLFTASLLTAMSINSQAATTPTELPTGLMPVLAEQLAKDNADLYAPTKSKEGLVLTNKKHGLSASFTQKDVTLNIKNKTLSMQLQSIGRDNKQENIKAVTPKVDGVKVSYQHKLKNKNKINHWFINSPMGLEQGFTISKKPAGKGELKLALTIESDYKAELKNNSIQFKDKNNQTKLTYNQLVAFDSKGNEIPSQMLFDKKTKQLTLTVNDQHAVYPLVVDPLFSVEKKLVSDGSTRYFGFTVSISGDSVVVGSDYNMAYVFQRDEGGFNNWGLAKKLLASDGPATDKFGNSVSISGDSVLVGAYNDDDNGADSGSAYIFQRNQGGLNNWGEVKKLLASDGAATDFFGYNVSISGDSVVVGAFGDDDNGLDSGSAYIFQRDQGGLNNWGEVKKLLASDGAATDIFGYNVSISGDTMVVGAYKDDDNGADSGSAYIFQRDQGGLNNWGEVKKLLSSAGAAGDWFGYSVSISGDSVVVGAVKDNYNGLTPGVAIIFQRDQGGLNYWGEVQRLTAAGSGVGGSVAIRGDNVAVGASGTSSGSGAVFIFQRDQGGLNYWVNVKKLAASDRAAYDYFGSGVAISDDILVAGAYKDSNSVGGVGTGSAYMFLSNDPYPYQVLIDYTFNATPVNVGDNFTYDLTLTNLDALLPVTNINVQFTLGTTLSYVSDNAACSHNAGVVDCNFSGLAAGTNTVISLTLQAGYTGQNLYRTDTLVDVNYTLADGSTIETLDQRIMQSNSENQAPTISGESDLVVSYNAAYSFTPTASDTNGDPLTFSIQNKPAWAAFNTSTGELSGTPLVGDVAAYNNIIISVTDGIDVIALPSFNLTVEYTAPVISGVPAAGAADDVLYSFTPTASDANGDALTFSIVNLPAWASFDTATGELSGTPTTDLLGISYSDIVITVTDGLLSAELPAFSITVNRGPVISGTPAATVTYGQAYSFAPSITDSDSAITGISVVNLPSWASFDSLTGAITGTPVLADVGIHSGIVISASDGISSTSSAAFNIEVVNAAPQISGTPATSVNQGVLYSFTPTVMDADTGTFSFSVQNQPGWAGLDTATGELSGTPAVLDEGNFANIIISVNDGTNIVALTGFSIEVLVQVPVANADSKDIFTANTTDSFNIDVLVNDVNNNGASSALTVSLPGNTSAQGSALSVNVDGTIAYTPFATSLNNDTFTYIVTDNLGKTASATVTVNVGSSGSSAPASSGGGGAFGLLGLFSMLMLISLMRLQQTQTQRKQ